jgi:hypothetical protein
MAVTGVADTLLSDVQRRSRSKRQKESVMKKLMVLAVTVAGLAASTSTYASNVASATATANLVTAISIAKATDLNFGYAVPGVTAGTVVVPAAPAAIRSFTGGVVLGNAGATTAAYFNVTGAPNATYSITLPGPITITDGTNNMTVNTFTSSPVAAGTLTSGGSQLIYVGATLQVGANQVFVAPFTGTFSVTVNYN